MKKTVTANGAIFTFDTDKEYAIEVYPMAYDVEQGTWHMAKADDAGLFDIEVRQYLDDDGDYDVILDTFAKTLDDVDRVIREIENVMKEYETDEEPFTTDFIEAC